MTTGLIPFDYNGHSVRIIQDGEELWWVANDLARVLEHTHVTQMLAGLDDDEHVCRKVTDTLGRGQDMMCVNESGLYAVIMRSNKSEAYTHNLERINHDH